MGIAFALDHIAFGKTLKWRKRLEVIVVVVTATAAAMMTTTAAAMMTTTAAAMVTTTAAAMMTATAAAMVTTTVVAVIAVLNARKVINCLVPRQGVVVGAVTARTEFGVQGEKYWRMLMKMVAMETVY